MAQFTDNFNSYVVDDPLAGQGQWTGTSGIKVLTGGIIGAISNSMAQTGVSLTSFDNSSNNWDISFKIVETTTGDGGYIGIAGSAWIFGYGGGEQFLCYGEFLYDWIYRDSPHVDGDVVLIKVTEGGTHIEFYVNGDIDTEYSTAPAGFTGGDGVFDIPFVLDTFLSSALQFYFTFTDSTFRVDDVIINYDAVASFAYQGVLKIYHGITFFDNFNSYTEDYLAGQGRWEAYGDPAHVVTATGTVASDGITNDYDLVDFSSDLVESAGWEFSLKLVNIEVNAHSNEFYIGNVSRFIHYNSNGAAFDWYSGITNELFYRDPNYQEGDIIKITRNGKHLEFFVNGLIDTLWYLEAGSATGSNGVFDCTDEFNWDGSKAIWLHIDTQSNLEIDDIRFDYNQGWTPKPLLVEDLAFERRPVRAYIDGNWELIQSF